MALGQWRIYWHCTFSSHTQALVIEGAQGPLCHSDEKLLKK